MFCLRVLSVRAGSLRPTFRRLYASQNDRESLDVSHSHFLAEASPKTKWKEDKPGRSENREATREDELQGVTDTRGKLSPTSSHLFKLILPLGSLSHPSNTITKPEPPHTNHNTESKSKSQTQTPHVPPTVILLHPSQPLSHVSKLILASLAPATPSISFRSISSQGQAFQWSDSTDLGDFIRDAARSAEFTICISYGPESARRRHLPAAENSRDSNTCAVPVDTASESKKAEESGITETSITVAVPTFADRTRFLRRRLGILDERVDEMKALKEQCDEEAHRGARKMALGGFGMLVVYWAAVARLTFWDYGWEIMEPITYLSGLSTVILGYLWFLYQGREVSYTSVLARSVSARREALYKTRGLDIERWVELMGERKALQAEIGRIALDYEGDEEADDKDKPGASALDAESEEDEGVDTESEESESEDPKDSEKETEDIETLGKDVNLDEQKGKRAAERANRAG